MKRCKRNMVIFCTFVLVIIFVYLIIMHFTVDTKYAVKFSKVLQSGNINEVDNYFDSDTIIICGDKKGCYNELRKNIINIFQKNTKYAMTSYGHGNNKFIKGIQRVGITAFIRDELQEKAWGDFPLSIEIERYYIFGFRIKNVEFENEFLEEMFFGAEETYDEIAKE